MNNSYSKSEYIFVFLKDITNILSNWGCQLFAVIITPCKDEEFGIVKPLLKKKNVETSFRIQMDRNQEKVWLLNYKLYFCEFWNF